jgi:hypothetical protein
MQSITGGAPDSLLVDILGYCVRHLQMPRQQTQVCKQLVAPLL